MTKFEDQLRSDLEAFASLAPSTTLVRSRLSSAADAKGRTRVGRLAPVLAAAAAVAMVSVGVAYVLQADDSVGDADVAPLGDPTTGGVPDQTSQREVSDFVRELRSSFGSKVYVATDWDTSTILVGAAPPVPGELQRLDETTVGGFRVDVFPAEVTVNDFEAFVKSVSRAEFPGKQRVCSFGLPADSAAVQVNVAGLSEMPPAEVAALQAQLENLTDARVLLVESRQDHPLSGPLVDTQDTSAAAC